MSNTTFEIDVPTPLLQFGIDQSEIKRRLNEWLVIALFTENRISSGKAARLLNISRLEFIQLLHARDIAYINYSPNEIDDEIAAVNTLPIRSNP